MKWSSFTIEKTPENRKFGILEKSIPMTNEHFLQSLKDTAEFIQFYNDILAQSEFDAFFWENKPITNKSLGEMYECNLINTGLFKGKSPDVQPFREYFKKGEHVVTFMNKGKDAQLVVPCPLDNHPGYLHISTFVRSGRTSQIEVFWRTVASRMADSVGPSPRWLSTSGLGVYWLHARIDTRPKYYQTLDYKQI